MRKVDLTMDEDKKYQVIKTLVDNNGNKHRAAIELGCTIRSVNRHIQGYLDQGKQSFQHGNRGRKPVHALSEDTKALILDLYRTKYYDCNFTFFAELLQEFEKITISESAVRNILMPEDTISPKARKITKRKLKQKLKKKQDSSRSLKEQAEIQAKIVAIEDAHSRRPRCANFGEMIQMDASVHLWFGTVKAYLHLAVDDATGEIVGAWFDAEETLNGYYNVFSQILTEYGIPYMFFTDRRTVFEYKLKESSKVEDDTFTQFGYACKQLGVQIETSSVPEAKGRVERMFETLQGRLPILLRLAGVTTLEQANVFLNSYIKKYNAQFALDHNHIPSVFEKQPDEEKINLTLAILTKRKVDNGHSVRFNKKFFRTVNTDGIQTYFYKGTEGLVIQAFNKELFFCVDDKVYALEEIPLHEQTSKNFDFKKPESPPKKKYIPPMNHPWRKKMFDRHVDKQKHRKDLPA